MGQALGAARSRWLAIAPTTRATIWIVCYCAAFATADALVKSLGGSLPPTQIAFLRYAISLCLVVPVVLVQGIGCLATGRPLVHATRAVLAASAQVLIYVALARMPLAEVTAINFARPTFMTVLAILLLSERVSLPRWLALGVGFTGVLIMLRPSPEGIDIGAGAAVLGTLMFAFVMIMIRMFAATERPIMFVFYYLAGGVILFAIPTAWFWVAPTQEQWLRLAAIAAVSLIAQVCGIRGFSLGESSVLAPIEYTRLLFALIIGIVAFAELPGPWTGLGAAVIVASTWYGQRRAFKERSRP